MRTISVQLDWAELKCERNTAPVYSDSGRVGHPKFSAPRAGTHSLTRATELLTWVTSSSHPPTYLLTKCICQVVGEAGRDRNRQFQSVTGIAALGGYGHTLQTGWFKFYKKDCAHRKKHIKHSDASMSPFTFAHQTKKSNVFAGITLPQTRHVNKQASKRTVQKEKKIFLSQM